MYIYSRYIHIYSIHNESYTIYTYIYVVQILTAITLIPTLKMTVLIHEYYTEACTLALLIRHGSCKRSYLNIADVNM